MLVFIFKCVLPQFGQETLHWYPEHKFLLWIRDDRRDGAYKRKELRGGFNLLEGLAMRHLCTSPLLIPLLTLYFAVQSPFDSLKTCFVSVPFLQRPTGRDSMVATAETSGTASSGVSKRTLSTLFWAFTTLIWSIFTPPHYTFAARVLICQPAWAVRMYYDDATWVQDLALFLSLHAVYSYWMGAWRFLSAQDFGWLNFNDQVFMLYIKVFALLGVCGGWAGGIVFRGHQLVAREREAALYQDRIDEQVLPPLLIPSRTSHSRLFPKKHVFSYSYLFVGIPVGVRGRISKALSVEGALRSWFHVDAADYLARGTRSLGLGEKLARYLHTQGVTDRDYSFAYLITAPRFLGYSFNPVSFWYLYDSDARLKFMILEVNNTFDERRVYLLKVDETQTDSLPLGSSDHAGSATSKGLVTSEPWQKDFHVSPFNSRNGSYTLRAIDPLATYQESGEVTVDNTIVLRSSKEHAKIVARVWSQGSPTDAKSIPNTSLAKFIAMWWWVGFLTFPRIVWEAQKLFSRKQLHVWYRPEVAESSIGREYSDDERVLESCFRTWLSHAVDSAQTPLRLIYEPSHHDGDEIVLYSPGFTYEEAHQRTLTLKVLSPAFYSRFVHYAHAKEAFDREGLATDEKSRTVKVEGADNLPALLEAIRLDSRETLGRRDTSWVLEKFRWMTLYRLRCPPPPPSYPRTANSPYMISDIRSFSSSELDVFVRAFATDSRAYRRSVVKLFLAQLLAMGTPAIVVSFDSFLRGALLTLALFYCRNLDAGDIFRPRNLDASEVLHFLGAVALANCVHIWSYVKG